MSAQQHGCYLANTRQRCDIRRVFQRQTSAKSCNRAIVSPFSTPPFSSGVPRNLNRSDTQPTRHNQLREKKIPKLRAPRSGTGILKSSTQHVEFHGQERLSRCCADTVSAACTWSKAIHRRSSQSTCPFKFGDTSAKWGADKKSVSKTGDRPAAKLPREFAEQTRKPFRRNGRQETCRGSLQSELQPFQTERHVSALRLRRIAPLPLVPACPPKRRRRRVTVFRTPRGGERLAENGECHLLPARRRRGCPRFPPSLS